MRALLLAAALVAAPAAATVHDLTLTGDPASGTANAFTYRGQYVRNYYFQLGGLETFTLENGDTVDFTVTLSAPFTIPANGPRGTVHMVMLELRGDGSPVNPRADGGMGFDGALPSSSAVCGNCLMAMNVEYGDRPSFSFTKAQGSLSVLSLDAPFDVTWATMNYYLASSAVPEPAQWAMMVLGFGLIGTAARRRARPPVVLA